MGIIISIALLITFFFTHNSDLAIAAGLFWIGGFVEFIASYFSKERKIMDALELFLKRNDEWGFVYFTSPFLFVHFY